MGKNNRKKDVEQGYSTKIFTADDFEDSVDYLDDDLLYGDDYFDEEVEYEDNYSDEEVEYEDDYSDEEVEYEGDYSDEEVEYEDDYSDEEIEYEDDYSDEDLEVEYYDDEEDDIVYLNDEEETEVNEVEYVEDTEKKSGWKKVLKITALSILGLVLAAYIGTSVYFMSHFYPYTVLNGKEVSMYNVEDTEAIQEEEAANYTLKLLESDNDITIIDGKDIDMVYNRDGKVKELIKSQNAFLWVTCFWKKPVINEPVSVSYNESKLNQLINGMECMDKENQVPSISAHPEVQGDKFVVVDEKIGTQLDGTKFVAAIEDAIARFADELDLIEADCYYHAKFNAESPEVIKACEEMNKYLGAKVTLQFTPHEEVVDASVIGQWIHFDENMKVEFVKDDIKKYVKSLAEKYDTYGKKRTFVTGYGNKVEVSGGNYGWKIDQKKEYETLLANVEKKEVVTREPEYKQKGLSHEGYDFGTTYVEVDLTNQHMFFFKDGKCVLDSPIVTGNPNAGNATPQGTYYIVYKQMHVNLRGPKLEDGTYEWDSPVTYWMPFNGGIGLHDATWQSSFGGSRYTWAGSHGCVNLPWSAADKLYPLVEAGTPVICHY